MAHALQSQLGALGIESQPGRELPARTASPDSVLLAALNPLVVVVDPASTGACLAQALSLDGHPMVCVWSDMCPDAIKAHTKKGTEVSYVKKVQFTTVEATVAELRQLGQIGAVMVGCETGVTCADLLASALGLVGNGKEGALIRRNKWHQVEAVRAAGLDAPAQMLARSADDVEAFLQSHVAEPFGAVVKPVDGAGSDGVFICNSPQEVREAFHKLDGAQNVLGLRNDNILLQEFLRGPEYVVDTVSANGIHKCVAIWKYDKRAANGAPVVYFGMRLMQIDSEPCLREMVTYVENVLNALNIRHGAMHTEIKLEERGPVLVEVNCRLHGGEGIWLPIAETCLGYTQVSAYIDAVHHPEAFESLPTRPELTKAHGAWVTIRSSASGRCVALRKDRLEAIRGLPSYQDEYLAPALTNGGFVAMTVDACSVHGCFNLVHADPKQLQADYDTAQAIIDGGILDLE